MDGIRVIVYPPYCRRTFKERFFFSPGDAVSGKAVLELTEDEEISSVDIEFKGVVHTRLGSGMDEHVHESILFSYKQEGFYSPMNFKQGRFFSSPMKISQGKHEYKFSFGIPKTWWTRDFRADRDFAAIGGNDNKFSLLPSCKDEGFNGKGEVSYSVTATVNRPFAANWEHKATITYSPHRDELSPKPEPRIALDSTLHRRSFRLDDSGQPRQCDKKELMGNHLQKSSDTCTINFSFSATAPSQIVLGDPYPIDLTLISRDELQGIEPGFILKSYELNLKSTTNIRVPCDLFDRHECFQSTLPFNAGDINTSLPVNKQTTITNIFPSERKARILPSSFKSLAISRSYGLELKLCIECLGEETTVTLAWPSVELLPVNWKGPESPVRRGGGRRWW